jgi:8-oxo-dGTP pyrophosphatase MutT (NUDIX family)
MPRELSAGAVVVRRMRGRWWLAAIRPQGKPEGVWALPKGLIDRGEDAQATALREVREETGIEAREAQRLGDVKYVYSRGGERIFKVVVFYLARAAAGRTDAREPRMRVEVAEARWLPLDDAPRLLAYRGERDMAERARGALAESGL